MPSGLWAAEEYDKLPRYDAATEQPPSPFFCHQQNGRLCAGWVGCHDMQASLALRLLAFRGRVSESDYDVILDYVSPVPLWGSGLEAAEHGRRDIESPGERARKKIEQLKRRLGDERDE